MGHLVSLAVLCDIAVDAVPSYIGTCEFGEASELRVE